MKVLITSDNHLGYKENDEIRGDDSFKTFEEILMVAKKQNVDFIIQGGDLFHDNRPSRYCIDRTIQLLNTYCTGKKKTRFIEIKKMNKMSESVSTTIPMLAIHGNHDDPSGINRISTLNILHSAGLICYIGQYTTQSIIVEPILINNMALYAIGHIKDRILYKSFLEGRVVFKKPENYKEYYNVLVLHQNRVQRNKEYVPESILEDFFDLVIYGHEHDSSITKGRFVVLQCGSTVRTSLCESETEDKYCYILEIKDSPNMRFPTINKIKLKTVRDFVMDTIKVDEDNIEGTVESYLNKMIQKTKKEEKEIEKPKRHKVSNESDANMTRIIEESIDEIYDLPKSNLQLPLIRLRVETYGLKILNNHKFGLKFKDRVANPTDMIRFIRKRVVKSIRKSEISTSVNIYDILKSNLHDLKAIPEEKFIDSLENFVNKDDKDSFNLLVQENVDRLVLKIDLNKMMIDDLENEIERINKEEFRKDEGFKEHQITSEDEGFKEHQITSEDEGFKEHQTTSEDEGLLAQKEEDTLNITDLEEQNISKECINKKRSSFGDKAVSNSSTVQLSSLNCSSIISDASNDKIKENTTFLTSVSNSIFKDLSYEASEKQSFGGRNSKEARKVLNSTRVVSNVHQDEENKFQNQKSKLTTEYNPTNRRILIDETQLTATQKEESNIISLEEESSTDFLFDF